MPYVGASLADGQLPDTVGTLFTATVSTIIRSFDVFNDGSARQDVVVYILRDGSTTRKVGRADLREGEFAEVLSDGKVWVLSANDSIQAETDNANQVDFTITGAELT
jgi:hypothetical protein